jgi:hypothetical protein
LNQTVPVMQIDTLKWQTNGNFAFRVTGTAPSGVVIQMSTNLSQWVGVQTSFFSGGTLFYTNSGAVTNARHFYRAETPP